MEGGNWKPNRWVVEGSHATGDDLGAEGCPIAELKLKLCDPEDQSYICSKGSGAPNPSEGSTDEKCENKEPTEHCGVDDLMRHQNLLLYFENPVPETNTVLEEWLEKEVFNCLEFVEALESESATMWQSNHPDQPDSRALEENSGLYEPTLYGREHFGDGREALYVENIYIGGWLLRNIFQQLIDDQ